jgi:hypothetical protein
MKIRVGIHSGPAYGAMTGGKTKIKYELMGDAVDKAEVVQSSADPGTVLISERVRELVCHRMEGAESNGGDGDAGFSKGFGILDVGKVVGLRANELCKCFVIVD